MGAIVGSCRLKLDGCTDKTDHGIYFVARRADRTVRIADVTIVVALLCARRCGVSSVRGAMLIVSTPRRLARSIAVRVVVLLMAQRYRPRSWLSFVHAFG